MGTTELASKVKELKELKALAEDLTAEITAIEDTLKAEMTARDTEELTIDVYKVRYATVKSKRLDAGRLKAEQGAIYEMYSKETTAKRFSVA